MPSWTTLILLTPETCDSSARESISCRGLLLDSFFQYPSFSILLATSFCPSCLVILDTESILVDYLFEQFPLSFPLWEFLVMTTTTMMSMFPFYPRLWHTLMVFYYCLKKSIHYDRDRVTLKASLLWWKRAQSVCNAWWQRRWKERNVKKRRSSLTDTLEWTQRIYTGNLIIISKK